jgi:hypothetical protein
MAVLLENAGANWTASSVGLQIPFAANCLGWFNPCAAGMVSGSSLLVRDYSPLNRPATLVAAPTINAGYISFGEPAGGQTCQTQILDAGGDFTIISAARSSDNQATNSTTSFFVTNYGTDSGDSITGSKGVSIAAANAAQMQGTDYWNNSGAATPTHANITETAGFIANFRMYALTRATVGGVTTRTLYDLTGNTSAVAPNTAAPVPNLSNAWKIGGSIGVTNGGQADHAHDSFFNRAMTLQQLMTLFRPMILANLATRGLTA